MRRIVAIGMMLCLGLGGGAASAQQKKDPNKEALRRLQVQLKQAQDEKAVVEQERLKLADTLKAAQKKAEQLQSEMSRVQAQRASLTKEGEALKHERDRLKEASARLESELAAEKSAHSATRRQLEAQTAARQRAEDTLATREVALGRCEAANAKLYGYHVEMINYAQSRGTFATLLEREPLTQLKRVELENLLERYRDKIDDERVQTGRRVEREQGAGPPHSPAD